VWTYPDLHRLLLSRHGQVQLRPLWCRRVLTRTEFFCPDRYRCSSGSCGVDTFRGSSGPYGADMSSPDQQILLLSRHVQVHLRPLWCRHVRTRTESFCPDRYMCSSGPCGVDTSRCSSGSYCLDISRPAPAPVVLTLPGAAHAPFVDPSRCGKSLFGVDTFRGSSGPYCVDMSRPAESPVVQTRPGAAQAPVV
jgi:hypothetical protein